MFNGLNGFGASANMDGDPEVSDHASEQGAAGLVDLLGHQSGHHLDDVRLQPELAQRIGGFESQKAASDDHSGVGVSRVQCVLGAGADRVEVVEGAVDVTLGQVVPGHRGTNA